MPASSVAIAMAPASASISLTRWPLPMPPIDGLHDICPSVSILWVRRSVRRPIRAAASAASVPAWPPPTTMTSNSGDIGPRILRDRSTWNYEDLCSTWNTIMLQRSVLPQLAVHLIPMGFQGRRQVLAQLGKKLVVAPELFAPGSRVDARQLAVLLRR